MSELKIVLSGHGNNWTEDEMSAEILKELYVHFVVNHKDLF